MEKVSTSLILVLLAIAFAVLMAVAVYKKWRGAQLVAKPGVMVCLFAALYLATGLRGAAFWFGVGALFSLAGDMCLLWRERMFVFGLAAFLVAYSAYVIGFNSPPAPLSLWSLLLALVLGIGAARVLRRLIAGAHASGQSKLALPVTVFGMVITLMMLSALLTLSNMKWGALGSVCVAAGAFLIYLSDIMLAWDKFVRPIANGRLINISLYQTGQVLLMAGVVMQFG